MKLLRVPLLNQAFSAGRATDLGDAKILGYRDVPAPKNHNPLHQYVMTTIAGNSLIDAHIADGDWILWRVDHKAKTGDLVVVATPYGVTVKYWHPKPDGTVRLHSANKLYKPQVWLISEVKIRGVVVMSGRDYT